MTDAAKTPHPIDVQVGQRIASLRQQREFNQSQLGAAVGVTFQQVQKYEKGVNRVSASKLALIADFLSVEVQGLFPPREDRQLGRAAEPSAIDRLGATGSGRELASLFVSMPRDRQLSLLSVARAIAGPSASELARELEAA